MNLVWYLVLNFSPPMDTLTIWLQELLDKSMDGEESLGIKFCEFDQVTQK